MKRIRLFTIIILSFFFVSIVTPSSIIKVEGASDLYPKIGFTWINGINGASELDAAGYTKAIDVGGQLEHREFHWAYLNFTLNPIYEWMILYMDKNEELESSISLNVISGNYTSLTSLYDFQAYFTSFIPGDNITRFNAPEIVADLKNFTRVILEDIGNFSYISFGSEINGFFESLIDTNTGNITNTAMLDDFVDMYEQMYDFVRTTFPEVKVLVTFRHQLESDYKTIEPIINRFVNACDIYAASARIFTSDFGFIQILSDDEIIERFEQFILLTGTKKFAITNTFTVSDSAVGSSEKYQASFVSALFKLVEKYSTKMEFLCWYRIFDFPPGYLGMLFDPLLEAQRTSGIFTSNGDNKLAYFAWVNGMRSLGRLSDYYAPWKISLIVLTLIVVVGFVTFTAIMEGVTIFKELKTKKKDSFNLTTKETIEFPEKANDEKKAAANESLDLESNEIN